VGIGSSSGMVGVSAATKFRTISGSDTVMTMGATFTTTSSGATTMVAPTIELNP